MGDKISRDELIKKLHSLYNNGVYDPEGAHGEFEQLLLDYIGDPEIQKLYEKFEFWYA